VNRRPAPPLPLGFLALAVGTLLLATLNLGWLEPADGHGVAVALVAFVAPLQLTASLMGFALGEVVPATAMALLAGTWTTIAVVVLASPPAARRRRSARSCCSRPARCWWRR
jgi:succinate-acetate transporter protein